jgi:hypothetical protein
MLTTAGQFLLVQLSYLLRRYKSLDTRHRLFEALLPFMREWNKAYRRHRRELYRRDKWAALRALGAEGGESASRVVDCRSHRRPEGVAISEAHTCRRGGTRVDNSRVG